MNHSPTMHLSVQKLQGMNLSFYYHASNFFFSQLIIFPNFDSKVLIICHLHIQSPLVLLHCYLVKESIHLHCDQNLKCLCSFSFVDGPPFFFEESRAERDFLIYSRWPHCLCGTQHEEFTGQHAFSTVYDSNYWFN